MVSTPMKSATARQSSRADAHTDESLLVPAAPSPPKHHRARGERDLGGVTYLATRRQRPVEEPVGQVRVGPPLVPAERVHRRYEEPAGRCDQQLLGTGQRLVVHGLVQWLAQHLPDVGGEHAQAQRPDPSVVRSGRAAGGLAVR